MARSRNIKPALFDNDLLADNEPIGRLLFIGLWTIADYKGELEWRERRIKKQLLAYDNCDIKKLMINLVKTGFIKFYSDGENIFVHIVNFTKHQHPHPNEMKKGSTIPAFAEEAAQLVDLKELTINHDLSRQESDDSITNPSDSLIPYPDSLILIPDTQTKETSAKASDIFDYWVKVMSKTGNVIFSDKRKKLVKDRLKDGYSVEDIKKAIDNCSVTPWNTGSNPQNKRFDDLELICRTGEKLEQFRDNDPLENKKVDAHSGFDKRDYSVGATDESITDRW